MYRRGGLYSSFVASGGGSDDSSENRPYRGAEIAPPKNLNSSGAGGGKRGGFVAASGQGPSAGVGVNRQG
jgi:hypothetical protein